MIQLVPLLVPGLHRTDKTMTVSPVKRQENEAAAYSRIEEDAGEKVNKRFLQTPLQTLQLCVLNTPTRMIHKPCQCILVSLLFVWISWTLLIPNFISDSATSLFLEFLSPYPMDHYVEGFSVLHPEWHPATRAERFPSVQERVKDYMGDSYYQPPCSDYTQGRATYTIFEDKEGDSATTAKLSLPTDDTGNSNSSSKDGVLLSTCISSDTVFVIDEEIVKDCARGFARYYFDQWILGEYFWQSAEKRARVESRMNLRVYCQDSLEFFDIAQALSSSRGGVRGRVLDSGAGSDTPILLQYGDSDVNEPNLGSIPVFKKFRRLIQGQNTSSPSNGQTCRSQPPPRDAVPNLVWKLNTRRHFHPLLLVPYEDTSWEKKKDIAVWRGAVTGMLGPSTKNATSSNNQELLCFDRIPRCKFLYENAGSSLVDAKFHRRDGMLPISLNGVSLFASPKSKRELMAYKAIIILEGNDVSSALKWSLYCTSVVIMPAPTTLSWALEHRLVPWTHYIPLEDMKQAEERMLWVLENDEEARKISERATLFIYDMIFHPDAMADERAIKEDMLIRYQQYFQKTN